MKKLTALTLGLLTVAALASCGNNSAEDEKKALQKVMDGTICASVTSGNPIMPDTETELSGDDNEALSVTVSQITNVNGKQYTTALTWSWEEAYNEKIKMVDIEGDATHKKLEFTYPGSTEEAVDIQFKVDAKCGAATGAANFKVKLTPVSIIYDAMTIADLYKPNQAGTNFEIVDETTGKIKTNHGQKYYYVAISGKLIYKSPDSNWGLLADGKNVVELYRLDACSDNDKAVVGHYITVYADISNGYGNIQLAYISEIEEMVDHTSIEEPVDIEDVKEGINDEESPDFKTFFSGISNANSKVTGTFNCLKDKSGNEIEPSTFDKSARQTLELTVGSETFVIAYDYHAGKTGDVGLEFEDIIKGLSKGDSLEIHGTLRWANDNGSNGISAEGQWTLTPYLSGDIVVQ